MTNELLAEVSILREKVEKYEKAIEDIKAEIIEEQKGYPPSADEYKTFNKVLQIIDKYIGVEE